MKRFNISYMRLVDDYVDPSDYEYEPENEVSVICDWCNGSGEGMYDGARCSHCKGKGEVLEHE